MQLSHGTHAISIKSDWTLHTSVLVLFFSFFFSLPFDQTSASAITCFWISEPLNHSTTSLMWVKTKKGRRRRKSQLHSHCIHDKVTVPPGLRLTCFTRAGHSPTWSHIHIFINVHIFTVSLEVGLKHSPECNWNWVVLAVGQFRSHTHNHNNLTNSGMPKCNWTHKNSCTNSGMQKTQNEHPPPKYLLLSTVGSSSRLQVNTIITRFVSA